MAEVKEKKDGVLPHVGGFKPNEQRVSFLTKYFYRFFNKKALEPLFKRFLSDLLIGGIQRMINGSDTQVITTTHTDYSRRSSNLNLLSSSSSSTSKPALELAINEFLVFTRADAEIMLKGINDKIAREGKVSVAAVNEATDKPDNDYPDHELGWVKIDQFEIEHIRDNEGQDKYLVRILPMPIKIKGIQRKGDRYVNI